MFLYPSLENVTHIFKNTRYMLNCDVHTDLELELWDLDNNMRIVKWRLFLSQNVRISFSFWWQNKLN